MRWPMSFAGKFVALTEQMMKVGPQLGMPYTRPMGKGLFEIRIKSQDGIARVFYCTKRNAEIVILHSFIKKTQKIPKSELDIARKRLQEVSKND
jgi:phage-related protein